MRQPNVLFILTDDQGYGDLGCAGNPWIKTPTIDALYESSIRFTNFHVGPTCAPTRSTLMTGHYANSTGVWHTIGGRSLLREQEVTLASAFKKAGYATGIFGKWHLGDNAPYRPEDRGFDEVVVHGGGGISQVPDYWGNDYFDDTYRANGEMKQFEGYCTEVWFTEALSFMKKNKDNPFLCYIPTNAPHGPFTIMKEYRDLYRGKLDSEQPDKRERFYGMITHLDAQIGALKEALAELGLLENTLLIFMTDNGTSCGAQFDPEGNLINGWNNGLRGTKNSEYDGGHRVPFFMQWPAGGLNTARDIHTLTASVDFMPTLLDLCGIEHDLSFHGTSLKPLMQDESNWSDRAVVTDSQRLTQPVKWRKSAVMTNRWRLVNGTELYDMDTDRAQMQDVSKEHPEMVENLKKEYELWWDVVSRQFDEEVPISIGHSDDEIPLTSHDWRGSGEEAVWNQSQIRAGSVTNSYWELAVQRKGRYSIELCRWPKYGSGRTIQSGIVGDDISWNREDVEERAYGFYTGGEALPIESAAIEIQGKQLSSKVTADDQSITFSVDLETGSAHLKTIFKEASGIERGAYYTYVTKI